MLRHVFLQDVVLDRALKLIARHPLLLSTRSNTMTDITNIPLDKLTAWEGNGRCRSSGGKDLRASSGTVELSLFSSLLATLPCWRLGPSSGSLASRRVVGA